MSSAASLRAYWESRATAAAAASSSGVGSLERTPIPSSVGATVSQIGRRSMSPRSDHVRLSASVPTSAPLPRLPPGGNQAPASPPSQYVWHI